MALTITILFNDSSDSVSVNDILHIIGVIKKDSLSTSKNPKPLSEALTKPSFLLFLFQMYSLTDVKLDRQITCLSPKLFSPQIIQ